MLEELQRRNYSQETTKVYLSAVRDFARYFHRSPEELGPEHIRQYQAHLFNVKKLAPKSVQQRTAALRFLFVKTLKRPYMLEHIPFPKVPLRLPTVLSPEEVTRLIDAAPNLLYRTILMTLYSTGMRRGELVQLKASDIDKELMVVHIRQGKGQRDRNVPLSPKLLDALREYWRWMRPVTYLFPGVADGRRVDAPASDKIVWHACRVAAERAGIAKHVHPHTLRHASAYCTTFQSPFILKTIGLDKAGFAEVYGHHAGPLPLATARPRGTSLFSRLSMAQTSRPVWLEECAPE